MVVFRKLCRITWSSRLHTNESVSATGHTLSAAMSYTGSDQKQQNFFVHDK